VVHALAKKGTTQRADFVAACFVPGLYVVLLWWIVLALVAAGVFTAIGWSLLWALLLLVALPRLGDFAMRWKDGLTAWRLMARARGWEQAEREALREAGEVVREWAAQGKHTHPEP
jgi:hypothetical protein